VLGRADEKELSASAVVIFASDKRRLWGQEFLPRFGFRPWLAFLRRALAFLCCLRLDTATSVVSYR